MPESIEELVRSLPSPVQNWYAITGEATGEGAPTRAKVRIYDAIGGWWGTNAAEFVAELDALDVDEIDLRINSPGGAVWDGLAIMNSLKAHRARVTATVDGLAASAASIVAMGADEVVMAEGSQMMIHKSSGGSWGNADTMREMAVILDKIDLNGAAIYARKAGGSRDSWLDLMAAETWYNADEAVVAGLADRAEVVPDAVDAEQSFNLSIFNYAGRSNAPAPRHHAALRAMALAGAPNAPVSPEPGNPNQKEDAMAFESLMAGLRERLGATDATDEAAILAAVDEALAARANVTPPEGVALIDQGVLDALKADAEAGRVAREAQVTARRDRIIAAALTEGRITKASAEAFRAQLDVAEEGTVAILSTLAPNAALPVGEIGYTGGADESSEDVIYNKAWGTTQKED